MMLVATGISKSFGQTVALNNVEFSAPAGQVTALIGENGSGKSTLMRVLNGETAHDSGQLTLDGEAYLPKSPKLAMESGVTLIHQELALCLHLPVWENIFLGAELKRNQLPNKQEMKQKSKEFMASLGHPDLNVDQPVGRLSPSVRQLVEIARALRSNSKVILFDEPTSSLGKNDVKALFEVISKLRDRGTAIVYITHFLDEVAEIADRATILRDGQLIGTFPIPETPSEKIAEHMTGREVGDAYPRSQREPGETILTAQSVTGRKLPKGITLDVKRGEVIGIAGLNGAGRTEFVRCLFGLDRVKSGKLSWKGQTGFKSPQENWKRRIGLVSEDRKHEGLSLKLSLAENLTMPNPGKVTISRKGQADRTDNIIRQLEVKCKSPGQKIANLSGGNQQKIAIGRLLDQNSELLILDEPTRGIDIRSKQRIYAEIDRLACEGKGVILVSSYLPELIGLCDRILVIRRGEPIQWVKASDTNETELMQGCAGA